MNALGLTVEDLALEKKPSQRHGVLITQFEQGCVALEGSRKNFIHKEPFWKILCCVRGGGHKAQKPVACTHTCAVTPSVGCVIGSVLSIGRKQPGKHDDMKPF